ncbi:MAG: 3-phosphoserine/phosphohydroxythreonine transaminase [Leptospirales bacterium]|nr:3-phosphoserine/phosphohydroxythreonine transaminase [Leptospirales bacterium]
MSRAINFSAGPATLPLEVLQEVQSELLDYKGSGMSIIEMSHRGKVFDAVYKESIERFRRVAAIPERFDVLYIQGGASLQFAMIPMNLSGKGRSAAYVNTGVWSEKAIEQAKIQGLELCLAASSEDRNHNYIPAKLELRPGLDYLHLTSNNTIYGTQWAQFPDAGDCRLAIDMSSDFLSRPIDWRHIGLAYAGLQKNAGPSGLTVVVIDREYYGREAEHTPTMLRYSTYAKNDSMYNTPPTFQIYVFGLILKWIESMGGLTGVERHNQAKAAPIYQVIDEFPEFYAGHAVREARSLMNITWNFPNKELEAEFLKGAEALHMDGLKGHRLVGGLRASIYNAMPLEGCQALANFMREFARQKG